MILVVTGSRHPSQTLIDNFIRALDFIDPQTVHHGGATGIDRVAHRWCRDKGRTACVHFPDNDFHGYKKAPLQRNIRMLVYSQTKYLLAAPMPNSRGTYHTIKHAKKMNYLIHDLLADGVLLKEPCDW